MKILVVAGEPSGDRIGGLLLKAIRERAPDAQTFGVGGPEMIEAGLRPLFDQSDLAVMGLAEVLPRLPLLVERLRRCIVAAVDERPDAVVTIDASSFSRRLARGLGRAGVSAPRIHYVAPMVWAWRVGRAAALAREFDLLLTLFPFEPPIFQGHGLQTVCVGHPVLETPIGDGSDFRARHGLGQEVRLLLLMPGSRQMELDRLLPAFAGAAAMLRAGMPGLRVAVATLPHLAGRVREALPDAAVATDPAARRDAMAAANAAIVASGTATLELAAAGVPMVVGYRAAAVTGWAARRLLRTRHVALPNILLDAPLVPELLQGRCTAEALADAAAPLLRDAAAAARQKAGFGEAIDRLGAAEEVPSRRAASLILSLATPRPPQQIEGEADEWRRQS